MTLLYNTCNLSYRTFSLFLALHVVDPGLGKKFLLLMYPVHAYGLLHS